MLRVRFQVSARIPSTTLGGMECHNSSGAEHRAYCGTNDCVVGDRQERLNAVTVLQFDDAFRVSRQGRFDDTRVEYAQELIPIKNLHIGWGFL
jgi:hypothetical protein